MLKYLNLAVASAALLAIAGCALPTVTVTSGATTLQQTAYEVQGAYSFAEQAAATYISQNNPPAAVKQEIASLDNAAYNAITIVTAEVNNGPLVAADVTAAQSLVTQFTSFLQTLGVRATAPASSAPAAPTPPVTAAPAPDMPLPTPIAPAPTT